MASNSERKEWSRSGIVLALLVSTVLGACDDRKDAAEAQPDPASAARAQAEQRILERAKAPNGTLRGVQVFKQAVPGTLAVCGQVNPSGRSDDAFIPFVTVVTEGGTGRDGRRELLLVQHYADSNIEATRVYAEMVSRCVDGGGPANTRRPLPQPIPPLPNGLPGGLPPYVADTPVPGPRQQPPAVPAPAPRAPSAPSSHGAATTRQHANIRTSPAGGGAVVRVVPPGSALRIFGEAPGGWYQVGEGEPWGWVHGSMLSLR